MTKTRSASSARHFDVIIWGCTGFTGRLACEYLNKHHSTLKWAIAGRNEGKVSALKQSLGLKDTVSVLTADLNNFESLTALTAQAKVLLTTAGPYAKLGTPMLAACVESGTHYCDLTGEAPWIRSVIDSHHEQAAAKRLKIVNCCGFDCIPCDLGAQMVVEEMLARGLQPKEVRFVAGETEGGVSGGTLASVYNVFESLSISELLKLSNPFYLNPRDKPDGEPIQPHSDRSLYAKSTDNMVLGYDSVERAWTMPYVMQAIDTRVVNRSNALSGWKYGRNFVFSERMRTPGLLIATLGTLALTSFQLLLLLPFTRAIIKCLLPQPGQGPSQKVLDNGFFTAAVWGKGIDTTSGEEVLVRGTVEGRNGDPGYRLTAKMVSEAAVCLATDDNLPDTYGVLTPSVAMGAVLRERLNRSGIHFKLQK